VLVLITFDADELVLGALRAGADGFLLTDTPPAEIVRAIELVAGSDARRAAARQRLDALTDREREVAEAIGQGKSNADIAAELYMASRPSRPTSPACCRSSTPTIGSRSRWSCRTPGSEPDNERPKAPPRRRPRGPHNAPATPGTRAYPTRTYVRSKSVV
jgi:hypothetical protein